VVTEARRLCTAKVGVRFPVAPCGRLQQPLDIWSGNAATYSPKTSLGVRGLEDVHLPLYSSVVLMVKSSVSYAEDSGSIPGGATRSN
jgi:hypothetical protein